MLAAFLSLIALGFLVALFFGFLMVYRAFQESFLWGLGVLLIPGWFILFTIAYWEEARRPLWGNLFGCLLMICGLFGLSKGSPPNFGEQLDVAIGATPMVTGAGEVEEGREAAGAGPPAPAHGIDHPGPEPEAEPQPGVPQAPDPARPIYTVNSETSTAVLTELWEKSNAQRSAPLTEKEWLAKLRDGSENFTVTSDKDGKTYHLLWQGSGAQQANP